MCEHDIGGSGKCSECVVLEIAAESVMPKEATMKELDYGWFTKRWGMNPVRKGQR